MSSIQAEFESCEVEITNSALTMPITSPSLFRATYIIALLEIFINNAKPISWRASFG